MQCASPLPLVSVVFRGSMYLCNAQCFPRSRHHISPLLLASFGTTASPVLCLAPVAFSCREVCLRSHKVLRAKCVLGQVKNKVFFSRQESHLRREKTLQIQLWKLWIKYVHMHARRGSRIKGTTTFKPWISVHGTIRLCVLWRLRISVTIKYFHSVNVARHNYVLLIYFYTLQTCTRQWLLNQKEWYGREVVNETRSMRGKGDSFRMVFTS